MTQTQIDPRDGQRWSVTRTGIIVPGGRPGFRRMRVDGGPFGATLDIAVGTWERLPDPEPEWQPGDLVLDAIGRILEFERDATSIYGGRWRVVRTGGVVRSDLAPRPLRRLVAEDAR